MKRSLTLILLILLTAAVGCSAASDSVVVRPSTITLEEARKYQNQVLLDLADYLPEGSVTGGFEAPIEKMKGLTCDWSKGSSASPHSGVLLPGGYDLKVSSAIDLDQVREQIRKDYLEKGWEAFWDKPGKYQDLNLISPEGYKFFLGVRLIGADTSELVISSFSPCLKAPEGFSLFDEY